MGTVRLDPERLEELARELSGLHHEFSSLEERVEDYQTAVGHRRVADKLESLAGNWSDDRKGILERLERLAAACGQVAVAYRQQEAALAQAMDAARGKSGL